MNGAFIAARAIVVVVFVPLLAAPFVVALLSGAPFGESMDWLWFGITAVTALIVVPVTWVAFRPRGAANRAFRGAPLGIGTLVSARPTGTEINDQPELELVLDVETADGRSFRGATREVVDLGSLPQFVPGATIPVLHLPDGRIAVAADASTESLEDTLYAARRRQGKISDHQIRVAKHGVRAKAVVMAMRPTGEIQDGDAVVRIEVRVTRADGTQFDATREVPVPPVGLPGIQVGSVVDVAYLPDDESYVGISIRMR